MDKSSARVKIASNCERHARTGPDRHSTYESPTYPASPSQGESLLSLPITLHYLIHIACVPCHITCGCLAAVSHGGPWVDDMRMAVSHTPAKFAIEIPFL